MRRTTMKPVDPVIDEQASLEGIKDLAPDVPPTERPWREEEHLPPEGTPDPEWTGAEVTGTAGGGMPEAAGQAEDPGTDTDINPRRPKERIDLDRV
jgi:hypothetical protein